MLNLKKNSSILLILAATLNACSTPGFKITKKSDYRIELSVSPDRILLLCPRVSDEKNIHLFMMPVLDEAQTVVMIIQGNNLGPKDCHDRIESIGKILKKGQNIYLAGMGDINEPRKKGRDSYTFPGHGTFYDHGRSLQFMAIANEHGDCYSAYHAKDKPCPRDPFPIKDNP